MASPAIGLRFRDTTPGVDTISTHKEILSQGGQVWWGWWKKDFEEDHADFLQSAERELHVLIVDRSTRRMFTAYSIDRIMGEDKFPDMSLVPKYYQGAANQVFGWFLLNSLEQTEYQEEVGGRFGDGTFIVLNAESETPKAQTAATEQNVSTRSSVLHLSDLHFGPDYDFLVQGKTAPLGSVKRTLTNCILEDLRRLGLEKDIAAILVTGDFTSNGDWDNTRADIVAELIALTDALGVDRQGLIALPGNHDVKRYPEGEEVDLVKLSVDIQTDFKHEQPFRYFLSELLDRNVKQPLNYKERIALKNADVVIGILNSCRILATEWTEYGYVGPTGLDILRAMRIEPPTRPTYRVMALHHHLLPVNEVEAPNKKGVTLSLDASALLEAAQVSGVHLAVHGHQHMPHVARYQSLPLMNGDEHTPITIISNGSTGVSASRRPGEERNTYCLLTFGEKDALLRMRELRSDGRQGAELFAGELGLKPILP